MMKKLIPILLIAMTVAWAQPGRGFGHFGMAPDKGLNLTEKQQEQITKLHTQTQTKAIDLRADLEKLQLELRGQLRADSPNKKVIDATVDKIAAKRGALQKLHLNNHLEVRAVLTPEQRELFDSRSSKRGLSKGHGHRKGHSFRRW